MIRAALVLLALSLAAPALAQSVPVRSGAHDGFDRLVIYLPRRLDYRVEPLEGGATIVFDTQTLRFDLDAAFSRIGRQRLTALSAPPGQGRLRLDLACDCALRPFWHGDAMLVIDIADPVPVQPAPHPATLPDLSVPSPAAEAFAARFAPAPAQDKSPDVGASPPPDLDSMRSVLLHQLGRAASQGLVMAAPEAGRIHLAPPPSDTRNPAPEPEPATADAQPVRPVDTITLRAHTSLDRDGAGRGGARTVLRAEPACPAPALLDVPSWGGPDSLPERMGQLYRNLFGEFDAINRQAVRDLARLYIHHGFGAEARQILSFVGAPDAETRLLGDVAQLVDQGPLPESAPLRAATGCGEPTVLWALLARGQVDDALTFDHAALQRSFAALPAGLRRSLGPGLVQHLIAARHADTASHLQRMIDPLAAPGEAGIGLARADLAARAADPDMAALAEVSRTNSIHAAEALAIAIEASLLRGAPVAIDQAQLAGAYAHELRGTAIGERLAVAHVSALAAAGAFDEAAAEFDRLAPDPAEPVARAMAESVLREATRAADDLTFLRYVLSDRFLAPGAMTETLAGAIARRLLDAGFADAADRVLRPGQADPALRLLRAEISLARARPAEAELALLSLDGPEADRLRARARTMRGDHATARALFAASAAQPEADRAALRTRDPASLAAAENPLLREVATVLEEHPAPAAPDSVLDGPRSVVEETRAARDVLTRLLAETPMPER